MMIQACYRQVFGNCYVMANERAVPLEAQLKDGRLCVREFIRGLAKSDFYISRFFAPVSPHRGVELTFKHLLGRPPSVSRRLPPASPFRPRTDSLPWWTI